MDCGKTLEELIPLIAAVKLSKMPEIENMTDQDIIRAFSDIMWDMESAYHDVREHGGLSWTGD